jgi:D-amino peptidase
MFIPEIETVVTKFGKGVEAAVHKDAGEACRLIREGAERAVHRMREIPPFTGIKPPYVFEARYYQPYWKDGKKETPDRIYVDDRTYRMETDNVFALPF